MTPKLPIDNAKTAGELTVELEEKFSPSEKALLTSLPLRIKTFSIVRRSAASVFNSNSSNQI